MTTHFTSGVTNVKAGGTGGRLKLPDPIKYHVYHKDFDKFVAVIIQLLLQKLVAETLQKL